MMTLDELSAITERLQTVKMTDPAAAGRILSILARHWEFLTRLESMIADCEEIEKTIRELESYLNTLPSCEMAKGTPK